MLGALRPRLFIVTTPNWEYNAVMRAAEKLAVSTPSTPTSPTAAAATHATEALGAEGTVAGLQGQRPAAGGYVWPGPPGRDGLPMRCNDHR